MSNINVEFYVLNFIILHLILYDLVFIQDSIFFNKVNQPVNDRMVEFMDL